MNRRPTELPPPRTIEDAYDRYVGRGLDIPDWDKFENAVDKIIRGDLPVFGHHRSCRLRLFSPGLSDVVSAVYEGTAVAKCIHCGGIVGHPFIIADETEVVPR